MNQHTTDKIIVRMLETRKVDNNKISKALFVSLRPYNVTVIIIIVYLLYYDTKAAQTSQKRSKTLDNTCL